MSKVNSYVGDSMVDLVVRSYGNIEGLLQFAVDNGLEIDGEEVTATERLVDDVLKAQLVNERVKFTNKPAPVKQKLVSYAGESVVDMVVRSYGNIEGILQFAQDNGLAIDDEETQTNERIVDTELKEKLAQSFFFSVKRVKAKEDLMSYAGESMVDLVMRSYGNVEGLVDFALLNGVALDDEETSSVKRLVDQVRKQELINERPFFLTKPQPHEVEEIIWSGQNFIDLALQELGSIEGLVNLLNDNGFDFDEDPAAGNPVKVLLSSVVDGEVRSYYRSLNYKVNTGSFVDPNDGIDYMIIEDTFIVR